jgi:anthranilate phosphoribosyltransferase
VLTALGVKVGLDAAGVERCIAQAGIGFMFAPAHHASMRNVAPVRTELGTRTIFNLIGPLSNPAGVRRQLLGAFAESWLKPMVDVLKGLGSERVWAVCGADGLDEITTTGPTHVVALENRAVRTFTITPEDVGMKRVGLDALRGGAPDHNAAALNAVLDGAHTPYRDIAVLNAAASLVVAEAASSLGEGVERAGQALASGAVKGTLARLVAASQG